MAAFTGRPSDGRHEIAAALRQVAAGQVARAVEAASRRRPRWSRSRTARSRPAPTSPSPAARPPEPGTARMTASAAMHPLVRWSRRSRPPSRAGRGARRARSRRSRSRPRPRAAGRRAPAARRPTPPADAGEDRRSLPRPAAAPRPRTSCAAAEQPSARAAPPRTATARTPASRRCTARSAYTPRSSGETSRSTTSGPRRRPTYSPIEMSLADAVVGGSTWSSGSCASAAGEQHPAARQRAEVGGHAHDEPGRQRRRRSPSTKRPGAATAGCTRSSPSPTSRIERRPPRAASRAPTRRPRRRAIPSISVTRSLPPTAAEARAR